MAFERVKKTTSIILLRLVSLKIWDTSNFLLLELISKSKRIITQLIKLIIWNMLQTITSKVDIIEKIYFYYLVLTRNDTRLSIAGPSFMTTPIAGLLTRTFVVTVSLSFLGSTSTGFGTRLPLAPATPFGHFQQ